MIKQKNPPAQLNALSEEIGSFIEYWGFKKIHGMIWTHLYLSSQPLSAIDLIQRLKVSKALISISIKELVKYHLIIQTPDSEGKKNKFYVANPDVFNAIRNVLENRESRMMERIRNELKLTGELTRSRPDSVKAIIQPDRFEKLEEMIHGASSVLEGISQMGDIDSSVLRMMFSVRE